MRSPSTHPMVTSFLPPLSSWSQHQTPSPRTFALLPLFCIVQAAVIFINQSGTTWGWGWGQGFYSLIWASRAWEPAFSIWIQSSTTLTPYLEWMNLEHIILNEFTPSQKQNKTKHLTCFLSYAETSQKYIYICM